MKLVVRFMKLGRMAFISHLDLQRALLRGLRSAGLTPAYSQGFNPHPKMSLALPLALGFESLCEWLEVELPADCESRGGQIGADCGLNGAEVARCLNDVLPEGIIVTEARIVDAAPDAVPGKHVKPGAAQTPKKPSLASLVRYAEYDITAPQIAGESAMPDDIARAQERISRYMAQEHIYVEKENKKKGRVDTIDIKPMICEFKAKRGASDRASYTCKVGASAGALLNPLLLIQSYYEHQGMPLEISELKIVRTGIVFAAS
jgi:radical SAM-linked protein